MTRIETERLSLRPYGPEDLELAAGLYGDPEVTRFTKLGRLDRAQAETTFAGHLAHWASEGLGLYALTLKDSGAFVGECGFFSAERPEYFLRYALLCPHWSQGLARISHRIHGLRGTVGATGQESPAARCGASGKGLDAACRSDSAARRVASRRPPPQWRLGRRRPQP